MPLPRIAGITRIRNEEGIIQETLDHFAPLCNAGIFVYDDASEDRTVEICRNHPAVKGIHENKVWETKPERRQMVEVWGRQIPYEMAQKNAEFDWVIYFDADERLDGFDPEAFPWDDVDVAKFRLFDFYITKEDVDKHYSERRWLGPEYRDIIILFRNMPDARFYEREPWLPSAGLRWYQGIPGYIKHYGKAISVEEFEKTCDYYMTYKPESFQKKWRLRKGKAIHERSDFGFPLITWEEREEKGFLLTDEINQKAYEQ